MKGSEGRTNARTVAANTRSKAVKKTEWNREVWMNNSMASAGGREEENGVRAIEDVEEEMYSDEHKTEKEKIWKIKMYSVEPEAGEGNDDDEPKAESEPEAGEIDVGDEPKAERGNVWKTKEGKRSRVEPKAERENIWKRKERERNSVEPKAGEGNDDDEPKAESEPEAGEIDVGDEPKAERGNVWKTKEGKRSRVEPKAERENIWKRKERERNSVEPKAGEGNDDDEPEAESEPEAGEIIGGNETKAERGDREREETKDEKGDGGDREMEAILKNGEANKSRNKLLYKDLPEAWDIDDRKLAVILSSDDEKRCEHEREIDKGNEDKESCEMVRKKLREMKRIEKRGRLVMMKKWTMKVVKNMRMKRIEQRMKWVRKRKRRVRETTRQRGSKLEYGGVMMRKRRTSGRQEIKNVYWLKRRRMIIGNNS
jgi:hypothetical protein